MHPILPFQQLLGDALIIHQPARRLPQCRIAQRRVVFAAGVETEVIDPGRIGLLDAYARRIAQRVELIGPRS